MCQLKVKMLEPDGGERALAGDVATLEVRGDDIVVTPLFDDPITVPHATIMRIDSMTSTVLLREIAP